LQVAPRRRVLSLFEPADSLGYVTDARERFSGRSRELEAAPGASRILHIPPASGDLRAHVVGAGTGRCGGPATPAGAKGGS
jgi:hypothetical protein